MKKQFGSSFFDALAHAKDLIERVYARDVTTYNQDELTSYAKIHEIMRELVARTM